MMNETTLSKKELSWLKNRRVTRLTDNKEVQIYPMGAERYLYSALNHEVRGRYIINSLIQNKNILVIPGFGNSGFLFANAGAQSVCVYDKDPVTIAWVKAFKKYYHYHETSNDYHYPTIGTLLDALTQWYPPLLKLPHRNALNLINKIINPNGLRRRYIHYLVYLVQQAILSNTNNCYELAKNITFNTGTIESVKQDLNAPFDVAYVPYLLGIQNGIECEQEIIQFIKKIIELIPNGQIIITPSRNTKEFYLLGKQYLITRSINELALLDELSAFNFEEDTYWYRTQGLCVFSSKVKATEQIK
jgi:hypothetical protein